MIPNTLQINTGKMLAV